MLRASVARDRYNPFAWYQLGMVYAAQGDLPRARLASAEQQVMSRQYAMALRSAQAAEAGLPNGSPDWLRAQDVGMQARPLTVPQGIHHSGRRSMTSCSPALAEGAAGLGGKGCRAALAKAAGRSLFYSGSPPAPPSAYPRGANTASKDAHPPVASR